MEILELKQVLISTLKSNGAFESLQAQIRAQLFNTLNEHVIFNTQNVKISKVKNQILFVKKPC